MIGTLLISAALFAEAVPSKAALPRPSGDPMAIDLDSDPIIAVERETAAVATFQSLMTAALERHPAISEARAGADEADAARDLARAAQLPSGDVSFGSTRTLARDFSNDPDNIIERSRRRQRTDAIASIQQPLLDFGASALRTSAAKARINAAAARVDATVDEIGLRAVASWYDVFAFRALAELGESFAADQEKLGQFVEARITQGLSARSDRARVTSFVASAESQRARIARSLASAEARFTELFGTTPPPALRRAPYPNLPSLSRDAAELRAANAPLVRAADAEAIAGQREAKAARADILPTVTAGIDAGRYGVFETDNDYDIRARLMLRYRLFGGGDARAEQFSARARSDRARADRIREEARRDAAIAWADVNALTDQLNALRSSYVAARQSRDTIAERFRVARGSLFDLLAAEQSYFETAAGYLQAITDLDTARYVLLARTGGLADVLAIGGK
jgi:outer membrane protein, adhesin transport system